MTLTLRDRFLRSCLACGPKERVAIFEGLLRLQAALSKPHEHSGAGLRKLHPGSYWEIRFGLSLRGVFSLGKDEAIFLFLGTHEEVQRFLKTL